ncbi:MFS transporter [Mesorhizobium sp. 1B3]|uniref:MFS transporter n=1 Tax=Mesorhizobium sp. 1B3 TaxID=3243599 RepID=UPI003D9712BD
MLSAGLIGSAAMGARQTFGLFVEPLSLGAGVSLTAVAFAIAVHNLAWGVAQPFAGAASDRYGPGPVVAAGAILLTGGLFLTAYASSALLLILGMGVLFGMGISCTSFGVVLTAVGKLARPEDRSAAMGLASAGGSVGQVLLIPFAQGISANWGVTAALIGLGLLTLVVAPLGYFLATRGRLDVASDADPHLPVRSAIAQAVGNDGYCLLTIGFFTCGFQLAFIATHLPTYLGLCGMPANSGAMALALIGLFNMVGSWGCGWLGGRFRQRNVLALVYLLRSAAIIAFFLAPKTDITVGLFAAIMGLLWLGTVPLTTGVIARIFGVRHLGTLFGMCFLSHQVGSFIGSWAGGIVLQQTGSYTAIWLATAAAGIVAAALHGSIRDKPATMALRA